MSPAFNATWREYYHTDRVETDCEPGSRPRHGCRCNECRAYKRFMLKLRALPGDGL